MVNGSEMLDTMVSSSRGQLDVKVVSIRTEKESMFKSVTFYELETTSSLLNLYELNHVYKVSRRFNDFK
jgi:hypothetical protein